MPRWVVVVIVAPLALCVVCASLGYFVVVPKIRTGISEGQSAVADEMAAAVAASVSRAISAQSPVDGQLVLTPTDIDVNNTVAETPGQCGFSADGDTAKIYGVDTEIDPAGISIVCLITYSAVPVVADGRVDLTQVAASTGAARFVFSKDRFEQGVEEGINLALSSHGLTPTRITLGSEEMTIQIARIS